MSIINNMPNSGMKVNGLIEEYYVAAGETVNAGDFVKFVNGKSGETETATSTDTLIGSTLNAGRLMYATQLDDTRVFILHQTKSTIDSTMNLCGVVCTIVGTKIISGADVLIFAGNYTGTFFSPPVLLSDNKIFISHCFHNDGYYLYASLLSVSGDAISLLTTAKVGTNSYSGSTSPFCVLLSNNNLLILHGYGNNYILYGIVCTISGKTLTFGTDTSISSTSRSGYYISAKKVSTNNIFIVHSYSTEFHLYGIICTVNGTTITKGTDTVLSNTSYAGGRLSLPLLLSSNTIFIAHSKYGTNGYDLSGTICTISGTTITAKLSASTIISQVYGDISAVILDNGSIFMTYGYDSTNYYLYGIILNINNTTITKGTSTPLNSSIAYTGYDSYCLLLNNNIVFVAHCYDKTNYYLYGQLWGISNNIPTKTITMPKYETQVSITTSSPVDGIAKSTGTGGNSSVHNDKIEVYVPGGTN